MKRYAIAFLVHPYKNALVERSKLAEAANNVAGRFLELASHYQQIRWNFLLPGYLLECVDAIVLSKMRELQKRGGLEWLCCGYTEPFLSFSPRGLSRANIEHGVDCIAELTGSRPGGFVPSFSNWEPSLISDLRDIGLHYAGLSETLFPEQARDYRGYWATEHMGSSIVLLPLEVIRHHSAPPRVDNWLEKAFQRDQSSSSHAKVLCIDYLLPLVREDGEPDPMQWLERAARSLERNVLRYKAVCMSELLSLAPPLGLQYIPSSLMSRRGDTATIPYFLNYLHTFDQVGLLQRTMMELAERVQAVEAERLREQLTHKLFFLQDINRYLPAQTSGFGCMHDRLWTYRKLIEIEQELFKLDRVHGGRIRIVDFLKNGSKNVVMANKALRLCIDHKNGAHLISLDFRERALALLAAYNPVQHELPRVVAPGKSRTAFIDHVVEPELSCPALAGGTYTEQGDFARGQFDYRIKKTSTTVKTVLVRTGAVQQQGKNFPLNIEKVFGLTDDEATISFAYRLSSHSLVPYDFKLVVELSFLLPGVPSGKAFLARAKSKRCTLADESFELEEATQWALEDPVAGVRLEFSTQKPVGLWCYPSGGRDADDTVYHGTTMAIVSTVHLSEDAPWSLMGKLHCRKIKMREGESRDEI